MRRFIPNSLRAGRQHFDKIISLMGGRPTDDELISPGCAIAKEVQLRSQVMRHPSSAREQETDADAERFFTITLRLPGQHRCQPVGWMIAYRDTGLHFCQGTLIIIQRKGMLQKLTET